MLGYIPLNTGKVYLYGEEECDFCDRSLIRRPLSLSLIPSIEG